MDCAPCAHAIRVSMKGIPGVNAVDVDLNTGLVTIKLNSGNNESMRQFNQTVEKNGFTHKDADIIAQGKLTATASAHFLEITGTEGRYALSPTTTATDVSSLWENSDRHRSAPAAAKGKVSDTLRYQTITEAR
ncbi:heavy-metal-associated domain-containing protein [Edaphobacter modestus]|nr:heavy metal-associated domain-containing protein [Edaphobacter modestus]